MPREAVGTREGRRLPRLSLRSAIVLVAAAVAAWFAGAVSLAQVYGRVNPPLAVRSPIARGDAEARMARLLLAASLDPEQAQRTGTLPTNIPQASVRLARAAFAAEPTSTDALTILALDANARGDTRDAGRLFSTINELSRRTGLANLWLAQEAIKRNDVGATLTHFDEMLRTTRASRDVVLQQFAAATPDPTFRRGMADLLRSSPPWGAEFWQVAPNVPGAAKSVGELRLILAGSGVEFAPENDRNLALQLVNAGEFDLAEALYRRLGSDDGNSTAERVHDWQFDRSARLPPVDWDTYSTGDFGSEVRPEEGILVFSGISSAGGAVARQWVRLTPGPHVLRSSLRLDAQAGGSEGRVLARLSCIGGGARLAQIELGSGTTNRSFSVSGDCREAWLDIVVVPGEGSLGMDGALDYLSIRPASSAREQD